MLSFAFYLCGEQMLVFKCGDHLMHLKRALFPPLHWRMDALEVRVQHGDASPLILISLVLSLVLSWRIET